MKWVSRWGYEMSPKPMRPGIYRLKAGGYFVRARVTDPRTKKRTAVVAVLRDAKNPIEAQRERDRLVDIARAELRGEIRSIPLWSAFAASLLEERVTTGEIESAATVERWQDALTNWLLPAFGHLRATDVQRPQIKYWMRETVLPWMRDGREVQKKSKTTGEPIGKPMLVKYEPTTVNGILRILATISEAIKVEFGLPQSAFEGIDFLPEGRIYTREEPNALPPDILPRFLARGREMYPQHYLMTLLGFVIGPRPGELRPLRRKGPHSDLNRKTGVLTIRRSHSRGHSVKDSTKTKADRDVALPPVLLEEIDRHIAALPTEAARASDLLFPADDGRMRSRGVLSKPFDRICKALGDELGFRITPRAMRRTFNDLARELGMAAVITRSISGHKTEEMQLHYSTARDAEQRSALERAHALAASENQDTAGQNRTETTDGGDDERV